MSTVQKATRRRGASARTEAIDAARALLVEAGPSAVTLKAVGERMGVSHANLIHHFGSAAGLQAALMERVVGDLADRIAEALETLSPDDLGQATLFETVLDAFNAGGAAELAAGLILQRETDRAAGLGALVQDLASRMASLLGGGPAAEAQGKAMVLGATYLAFADALIGPVLGAMLDLTPDARRELSRAAVIGAARAVPPAAHGR